MSPGQVRHHQESTELQYRLVERAVLLGWPGERVHVIDDDLGKSGASVRSRIPHARGEHGADVIRHWQAANRRRLQAGELGLDIYGMCEPCKKGPDLQEVRPVTLTPAIGRYPHTEALFNDPELRIEPFPVISRAFAPMVRTTLS